MTAISIGVWSVGLLVTVAWCLDIRQRVAAGVGVTRGTVNITMLLATSLTVTATTETFAALHLLWMFPASSLAGLLSALIFPFNLLSIPGWAFGELC
jgi:hypothetical protein